MEQNLESSLNSVGPDGLSKEGLVKLNDRIINDYTVTESIPHFLSIDSTLFLNKQLINIFIHATLSTLFLSAAIIARINDKHCGSRLLRDIFQCNLRTVPEIIGHINKALSGTEFNIQETKLNPRLLYDKGIAENLIITLSKGSVRVPITYSEISKSIDISKVNGLVDLYEELSSSTDKNTIGVSFYVTDNTELNPVQYSNPIRYLDGYLKEHFISYLFTQSSYTWEETKAELRKLPSVKIHRSLEPYIVKDIYSAPTTCYKFVAYDRSRNQIAEWITDKSDVDNIGKENIFDTIQKRRVTKIVVTQYLPDTDKK